RIIQSKHDDDSVADDPLINRSDRELSKTIHAIFLRNAGDRRDQSHTACGYPDTVMVTSTDETCCFQALRSGGANTRLPSKYKFNALGCRGGNSKIDAPVTTSLKIVCKVGFYNSLRGRSGIVYRQVRFWIGGSVLRSCILGFGNTLDIILLT